MKLGNDTFIWEVNMSKKYENLARAIIRAVGGKENILDVYHCQTRLRFKLVDEKKANEATLAKTEGVAKVIQKAGVYQVVIGTHVADVYEEVEKLVGNNTGRMEQSKESNQENNNLLAKIIDFVAGVFQPVIPALSGAGMVKALLALLVVLGVTSNQSQTYYLLNLFADGVFFFLPIILAFTTAQKLKCNPILAVGVAAMMLHPNWSDLVTAGAPVQLFGVIPFTLARYSSSIIPIILVIFVQSYVEKILKKWIPKAIELVFLPMLTFLIMGTLAFSVLGPIGAIVGGYLATFFTFLSETAAWAPAVIIGGTLPVMVMFGLHNAVAPLGVMQMANIGFDSIFGPGCVCSNMAQATAAAVVGFRTKDKKTKQIATSGSITAYMGITEPALYGVNLPKKYPLVASMIGGACGGLFAGLTNTHRFATGSSGLPAVLLYLGDNTTRFFVNIIIAIIISVVVTAVLTFILSFKFEKEEAIATMTDKNVPKDDFSFSSPVKGKIFPLSKAADEAFSSGVLGEGVVIEPSEGKVIAPFDATISALFPTNHAIGLSSDHGVEVLIHVGINTVQLDGKFYQTKMKQGDRVKAGDTLIEFDMNGIKNAGYSTQTMVIVTNNGDFLEVTTDCTGDVNGRSKMITLVK